MLLACITLFVTALCMVLLLGRQVVFIRTGRIAPKVAREDDDIDTFGLADLTAADVLNLVQTILSDIKRFAIMFSLKLSIKATNFAKRKTDAIVLYVHQKARERLNKERRNASLEKPEPNKFLEHIKNTTAEK